MEPVSIIDIQNWDEPCSEQIQSRAVESLELGKVLFFPHLKFHLNHGESRFLHPGKLARGARNISLDPGRGIVSGTSCRGSDYDDLREMMLRLLNAARTFVNILCPRYSEELIPGRTSLQPVAIGGRRTSNRLDDTLLHVDAFPAYPVQGKRILRVLTNVSPERVDRVWRIGEPFEDVARRFLNRLPRQLPHSSRLLELLGITKGFRTEYDYLMLRLHNAMKKDKLYQQSARTIEVTLPPGSTWLVFTDAASHAARSGQHVLEQTFYLPVDAMAHQDLSPLRILERLGGRRLT